MKSFGIGFFAILCLATVFVLASACGKRQPATNSGTSSEKSATEPATEPSQDLVAPEPEPEPPVEALEQSLARLQETADRMDQKRSDLVGSTKSLQENLLDLIEIVASDAERQSADFERTLQAMTFQLVEKETQTPEAVSVDRSEPNIFQEPSLNLVKQEN